MKLYVLVTSEKNADGDCIQRVEVFRSQPSKFTYIVWEDK